MMNADDIYTDAFGDASTTVSGHTLREIVTDPAVRVRGDAKPCVACHPWAGEITKGEFCAHVPTFLAMPTATGNKSDPPSAKPQALKDLLTDWYEAGCPD